MTFFQVTLAVFGVDYGGKRDLCKGEDVAGAELRVIFLAILGEEQECLMD